MKIKIIIGIVLSIFFSFNAKAQNDWKNFKLKTRVQSIKVIDYNVVEHFGKVKKTDIIRGENFLFNESGFVTIKKRYGANGEPVDQASFVYDVNNSIVEQNISDRKGKLIGRITNEYDEDEKRTYESSYKFDGSLQSRAAYTYADKKKLKEIVTFDSTGDKKDLQIFDYHKRKLTKLITRINPKSNVRTSSRKYDKNDNLLESTVYDVIGDVKTYVLFKYDKNGNNIESKYFDKEDLATKRSMKYNTLDFLVEEKIEYPLIDKTDFIIYSYKFDLNSNWIQQIKYVNSVPIKISERTITYFQSGTSENSEKM